MNIGDLVLLVAEADAGVQNPVVTTSVLVVLISTMVPAVTSVVVSLIRERYSLAREKVKAWQGRCTRCSKQFRS